MKRATAETFTGLCETQDKGPSHLHAASAVPGPETRTEVKKLQLTNFRNYASLEISLQPQVPVVLAGPNGAGKTNLLEAVSFLFPGRGLRRARREDIASRRTDSPVCDWSVYAEVNGPSGPALLGTGLKQEMSESRRMVRINQAPAAQNDLLSYFTVSWLTPQMDGLFLASPAHRRRFLDRLALVFDPAHAGRLARYEKAWRERGHLLNEGITDPHWLASIEQILAETGVAVMATRAALLVDINAMSAQLDTDFPPVSARLEGDVASWLAEGLPAVDIEDRILLAARQRRIAGDMTVPGAHDADFTLYHRGHSAAMASTGEQKALLISMILSHALLQGGRLARPPVLLLDDVAAHLDAHRRAELFDLCSQLPGQIWYSGADRSAFAGLGSRAQYLMIEDGRLVS